ncbi:autotransporter domain-containing protein [Bradyrhizobium jicamae]|uniref:autotransporter outer membrane beta-barrel domain-containing protein n=1 Tax=Bradyrhizobium jicamae TaxID=280332 RepID=UPI001BA651CE|nr:autotransporter domain-containing protein [Bradyrhizobium jicamae]MBR0757060.1 autotransporter domain-containing protein [Bradyrhizobium jicamae]
MADLKLPVPFLRQGLNATVRQSVAVLLATTALGVVSAHAVDGTWTGATSTEWTDGTNWTSTPTVPDGTATFTNTGSTTVDSNALVNIGSILFTAAPNAQAYTINTNDIFVVNGAGVSNNSTNAQTFNVSSSMVFTNSSTASGGSTPVTYNVTGGTMAFNDTSSAGTAVIVNFGNVQFFNSSTAGSANITNNIGMDFFDNASAGSATISNGVVGVLTFNGSTTAATASITNDGTLQFNNSSTAGSSTITNTSSLTFSGSASAGSSTITNNSSLTFSGSATAGSSTITTNNGATTSFTGSSTGGGARFITASGGTFDMSGLTSGGMTAGSIEGAGNYVLGAKTLTTGSNNLSTQVDGVISGTGGGLTKVGTGTMTLTAANTYTGPTTISAGTLALSGAGSISNSSVVTVNGTFDVSAVNGPTIQTLAGGSSGVVIGGNTLNIANASTEFAGSIQGGTGVVVQAGTQTLSGVNTYLGTSGISNGATLALKGNGSIANSIVTLGGTGTLDISQTTTGTSVGGLFAFFGGVVALGSKTLTLTGATPIYDGVIQDGGIGFGTGGSLTIASGASQILGGTNTYTGTTTIAAGGSLYLQPGVITGQGSIAASSQVIVNGLLEFDVSAPSIKSLSGASTGIVNIPFIAGGDLTITDANGTFSGSIQGAKGIVLAAGTEVLAGANTYTGNTTVNGGTLVVDGSIATSALTTVNAGGTLAGSGTVGNTAVAGGTLVAGSTGGSVFGPLTVQGNLSFTAASTYMIQVSPTNAGLTNVSGTADLGGAKVNAVFQAGSYVNRQYTILSATGGLNNTTFDPTVISNNSNLQSTLSYDANNAYLNIQLKFISPTGLNLNQQNVANTLTNFFNTTGSIPAAFAMLNAAGLTVASGELGTGVIQSSINADSQFLNLLLDPTIAGRGAGFTAPNSASRFAAEDDALDYAERRPATASERAAYAMATKAPLLMAAPANRWSVWGAGYGGSATTSGNAVIGSQDTTARIWGVAAGADYKINPDTLVGFALGGGGTNYSLANAMGSGSADLFQAGVFGRHNIGPAYLAAALGYGWHDVTTNRTVTLAGFDQLQGRFRAESFSARFEGGYRFATPFVGITPYAAAQAISFHLPGYGETAIVGTPQFALNYNSQTTTATRTELGLRTDKSYALQDAMLTLRGRLAWAHDYNNDRAVTAIFQTLPGASFVVNGAKGNPDSALVSGGAEVKWLNGFSLAATFEGEFSGNVTSYAGKGVAKYSW